MKNIKFLLVLVTISILTSCNSKQDSTIVNIEPTDNKVTFQFSDSEVDNFRTEHLTERPFSNPVLVYGSSFGEFFQALYKTGKFEDMLKFTSSNSIEKFGRDKVLNFYKTMDFAYSIKLKSMNAVETPINVTTLNYEAGIMATRNILRMDVVLENDSCKIILKDIKNLR